MRTLTVTIPTNSMQRTPRAQGYAAWFAAGVLSLTSVWCSGQTVVSTSTQGISPQTAAAPAAHDGSVVDQVVAVVNGDLVLESDVDEERRFAAFQPFRDVSKPFTRQTMIERLVDRTLILQQAKLQFEEPVTDAEVNAQLMTLRKDIPACKEYQCETEEGWQKFITAQGFTSEELMDRWRERMRVLRFIEMRFKMGIRIGPEEIKAYYDKTLLPNYASRKATAPKLATISDRIQEILLQQQVSALLVDWLKSLKAQGSVRVVSQAEGTP